MKPYDLELLNMCVTQTVIHITVDLQPLRVWNIAQGHDDMAPWSYICYHPVWNRMQHDPEFYKTVKTFGGTPLVVVPAYGSGTFTDGIWEEFKEQMASFIEGKYAIAKWYPALPRLARQDIVWTERE